MKTFSIGVSFLAMILLITPQAPASEITIVGTGSGMAILKSVGEAFTSQHPEITVQVPKSIGSGGGIKAVGGDREIIGRVAREIKDKEKHFGLTYAPMARMPIIFYLNKSVGIKTLSPQQICDIYSGKTTNWKDVGGSDSRIKVIRREEGDSSLSVLRKTLPGFKDITLTTRSKTTHSDQLTFEAVEKTADTIAFGTFGNAKNYDVDIVSIGGALPDQHDYPYTGTLALIFKEANKKGDILNFVDFATSSAAHAAIRQAGGLPY